MDVEYPYYDVDCDGNVFLIVSERTCLKVCRSDGGEMTRENFNDLFELTAMAVRDTILSDWLLITPKDWGKRIPAEDLL
jgi:hypothetical protein